MTDATLPLDIPLALRTGFRLQYEQAQQAHVLLYPEGMVTLSESAHEIIRRCDGTRSATAIVQVLEQQFPGQELRDDVLEFLGVAWDRGWLAAKPADP